MDYVISLWEQPAVPVEGQNSKFPIRRIYCVGRNYAEHTREMGFDPDRELPFFFCKPADAIVQNGGTVPYPLATKNLAYEIELVVAVGKTGKNIPPEKALDYIYGYAVGLDMTRRDLQIAAREKGRPWDTGKGFDHSAPMTAIRSAAVIGHPKSGKIWLEVNGEPRQKADLTQLIWSVPEIIAYLSQLYILQPGDVIFTGTPAGVGPVKVGDKLRGGVDGVGELSVRIGQEE